MDCRTTQGSNCLSNRMNRSSSVNGMFSMRVYRPCLIWCRSSGESCSASTRRSMFLVFVCMGTFKFLLNSGMLLFYPFLFDASGISVRRLPAACRRLCVLHACF